LTDALAQQIGKSDFYGLRFSGERFDCGSKMGFLQANIAFAMANETLAPDLRSWIKDRFS
jgi:UTP--glucose-1-phosphate uridylyltransferase